MLLCVISIWLCGFSGFTCNKQPASPVVARVGKTILTINDISADIPHQLSGPIEKDQLVAYVKQWIDDEVLYQEGLRAKIDKEPAMLTRFARAKKDLLCAEVINRYSIDHRDARISQDMVDAYFNEHKQSYIRDKDVFKYIEIVVSDIKTAWSVHAMVTTDNFSEIAGRYSEIPNSGDPAQAQYLTLAEILPPVAEIIPTIKISGTTTPIKTSIGYHIIRVLDKQKAGTQSDLSEVRDNIVAELSARTQKSQTQTLLESLRPKMDIEYHLEQLSSLIDSATSAIGVSDTTIKTSAPTPRSPVATVAITAPAARVPDAIVTTKAPAARVPDTAKTTKTPMTGGLDTTVKTDTSFD